MLTSETRAALAQALDAVMNEAGDDPAAEALVNALTEAQDALESMPDDSGEVEQEPVEDAPEPEAPEDSEEMPEKEEEDPYSFDTAKKKFQAKRSARSDEEPSEDE